MTLRFTSFSARIWVLGLLVGLAAACAPSSGDSKSDSPIIDIPDTTDVVLLKVDSNIVLDTTQVVVTVDDGKSGSDIQPCNEQQKKEIASKRKAIADLEKDIAAETDGEIATIMQEELVGYQEDLTETLERFGCDG